MPVNVYVAMQYWHPFTKDTVQQASLKQCHCHLHGRMYLPRPKNRMLETKLRRVPIESKGNHNVKTPPKNRNAHNFVYTKAVWRDRITKLIVLPLYPQFSISTTGSSIRVLQTIFREDAYLSRMPISIIQSWCQREGYIKSMADLIEKELESFSTPKEVMIFISAHGVPVSYVEDAGDPYRDQMEECIHLIMQGLKSRRINNDHTLAYQSHVGPVQWLKPYTDEVLVERGKKGVKSLLAVPVSFVGEHIKTLEEIDMECKHLALESGIENWGRVCALGCTTSFITDMADVVIEVLPSATAMTTSSTNSEESDYDPVGYAIKMFFGSILAFVLLLSPKMIMAFRNHRERERASDTKIAMSLAGNKRNVGRPKLEIIAANKLCSFLNIFAWKQALKPQLPLIAIDASTKRRSRYRTFDSESILKPFSSSPYAIFSLTASTSKSSRCSSITRVTSVTSTRMENKMACSEDSPRCKLNSPKSPNISYSLIARLARVLTDFLFKASATTLAFPGW
ncbi:hypothetical protein HYC85_021707 [Camellia sinensis]|uniref:Ferrochelatase n=1 Tax=Camellia sinensis TaxID=4442 RepID=A0A7J7GID8_CAMSI|nr:hypothetical protein HYC85_021707 [Camellia sinensis]